MITDLVEVTLYWENTVQVQYAEVQGKVLNEEPKKDKTCSMRGLF